MSPAARALRDDNEYVESGARKRAPRRQGERRGAIQPWTGVGFYGWITASRGRGPLQGLR
jgi:hypothetical protein